MGACGRRLAARISLSPKLLRFEIRDRDVTGRPLPPPILKSLFSVSSASVHLLRLQCLKRQSGQYLANVPCLHLLRELDLPAPPILRTE